MRLISRPLPGMLVLQAEAHTDARGSFARCFCREELADARARRRNRAGEPVLFRAGRHAARAALPAGPSAETKVVTCLQGALHDVVLDLRPASPSYGQHAAIELTAENRRVVVVPEGCAHGFLTLTDATLLLYLVTAAYDPIRERAVRWDDPGFAITWPFRPSLLSPRDAGYPDFDPGQHRAA